MTDEPQPAPRPLALKVNMWNRAALVVLGLVGLGAGGAAVFITHLEAGPVALIVAGLLLLLIGMGGRMPSRLKVGDNEAAWEIEREAVQVFVERIAEEVPAANQREFLGALGDLAEDAPEVAARGLTAMRYEMLVRQEIESITQELEASSHGSEPIRFLAQITDDKQRIDATLEGPKGRRVVVQINGSTKSPGPPFWIEILPQSLPNRSRALGDFDAMLFITRVPLGSQSHERVSKYPEVHHVLFRGPQDREKLKRAVCEVMK